MASKINHVSVAWTGPSELDGKPVALLACVGGNLKVGGGIGRQVVALSVVSLDTVAAVLHPDNASKPPIQMGTTYVASLDAGAIDSVCDDSCVHKHERRCYAQFNIQSVTEPIATIRRAFPAGYGSTLPVVLQTTPLAKVHKSMRGMLRTFRFREGDRYRLMVVGSSAAVPAAVIAALVEVFEAFEMTPLAYVENWRDRPDLRLTHMASCYSARDVAEAIAADWVPFYSPEAHELGNTIPDGMIMCPGSAYRAKAGLSKVTCAMCGLCSGARADGKIKPGVVSIRHANGDAGKVAAHVRHGRLGRLILNNKGRMVGAYAAL